MRKVSVYSTDTERLLLSSVTTVYGFSVIDEPKIRLLATAEPLSIGNAVLECLDYPKDVVPYPDDIAERKSQEKKPLEYLGVKRWSEFARNSRMISVKRTKDGKMEVIPYRIGEKNAFYPDYDHPQHCEVDSAAIGNMLRSMFAMKD